MNEKAITAMNEEEILAHIAQQRLQREQRHAEASEAKARKAAAPAVKKAEKAAIDNAFDELLKTMLGNPLPPKETK